MRFLSFLSTWSPNYRNVYKAFLLSFSLLLLVAVFAEIKGLDTFLPLETVRKTESVEVNLHELQDPVFKDPVSTRSYIIFQGFLALKENYQVWVYYLFIMVAAVVMSFYATALTYLSKLWFAVGQSLLIIWVMTMNLNYLNIYGLGDFNIHYLLIVIYLVIGYLFRSIYPDTSLFKKFSAFLFLSFSLLALVYFGSAKEVSLVYIANNSAVVAVFISIVFIMHVAYDILLLILKQLTNSKATADGSNLRHFLFFSIIYLGYISLTFLRNDHVIRWDIIYFDEFLLLIISSIVGIWGFRKRSELINDFIPFRPLGGLLYLMGGILTFSTIAWVFFTANDPLIDVFEDAIIYAHLGFGIAFTVYVLFNFFEFLRNGSKIYPVIFQPKRFPTGTIRIIGIAMIALFVIRKDYIQYFQAWSGYYNSLADYYLMAGKTEASVNNRQVARQYFASGHKSNFMLGLDYYDKQDYTRSAYYFGQASYKRPSVQSYLNRAQSQLNANLFFESLFTLRSAQEEFQEDPHIVNMKGLLFEKLNQLDSAFIYFNFAEDIAWDAAMEELFQSNKLALYTKNQVNEKLPEVNFSEVNTAYKANYVALANSKKEMVDLPLEGMIPPDSMFTYNDFSLLFNQLANQSLNAKRLDIDLKPIKDKRANEPFSKSLSYAESINLNYSGAQKKAFSLVYELENDQITDANRYVLLHAKWLFDQKAYSMAEEKLRVADRFKDPQMAYLRTLALIKNNSLYEAKRAYDTYLSRVDIDSSALKQDTIWELLNGSPTSFSDQASYLWYTHNPSLTEEDRMNIHEALKGTKYEMLIRLDEISSLIEQQDYERAINSIEKLKVLAPSIEGQKRLNELKLVLSLHDINVPSTINVNEDQLGVYPYNYQLLLEASHAKVKRSDSLEVFMERLAFENAFFVEGIMYAVDHYNETGASEKAYKSLVEAVRLNPNNMVLLKAYALQSLKVQLRSYAEDALNELKEKLDQQSFEEFKKEFDQINSKMNELAW